MRSNIVIASLLFIIFACNAQNTAKQKVENNDGIIYFSADEGLSWQNTSNGLPQKIKIGLGGVAATPDLLAVAAKDEGVFVYDAKTTAWSRMPTEKNIVEGNIGTLVYHQKAFYVGTQFKGVFVSNNNGESWNNINAGLNDLTIRRFEVFAGVLYVCTNDGLYAFDDKTNSWKLEFGETGLQVNGVTMFRNLLYIATNKGVYGKNSQKLWGNLLPHNSVHNIGSDANQLYAMTYTSLLLSSHNGKDWQNAQFGLPALYTFNVITHHDIAFAGQWDGVYTKTKGSFQWQRSANGLPEKFAVTNLKIYGNILIISTSERKLKK